MKTKNKIITINNVAYILQHITLEAYNTAYSTCERCDCRVRGVNTASCLAMDYVTKNVPCEAFSYFKKLSNGL